MAHRTSSMTIPRSFMISLLFLTILQHPVATIHQKHVKLPRFSLHTDAPSEPWLSAAVIHSPGLVWKLVSDNEFEIQDQAQFEVKPSTFSDSCYDIGLVSRSCLFTPHVCFDISNKDWYGGGTIFHQLWPLNDTQIDMQPFVPRDLFASRKAYGNVIERYWLNSAGVGIYVTSTDPLSASFNENGSKQMCISAPHTFSKTLSIPKPELSVTVCKTKNIKETHVLMSGQFIARPSGVPDERMFRSPVWSTWAKYKININDKVILGYADEIKSNNFSNSQLEIDDMFSTTYGELDFKPEKFSDPGAMISKLKDKGFRVTVWVTPFANLDSPVFEDGLSNGYWMKFPKDVPALVRWWQGIGAVLDVYNPGAVTWFQERLQTMKEEFGVDSFKFDAGEVDYLPDIPADNTDRLDLSTYATKYVEAVSTLGGLIEVRCGYRTQREPVFVRMADKSSDWSSANGLRTLIPTTLTMGILGYPYILPDMIGGNAYDEFVEPEGVTIDFRQTILPERELYIRWLQLTTYLPAMQFSISPWQYDAEVIRIAQKFVKIHEEIVTPMMLQLAEEATSTGVPMIRPLWWIAPDDLNALQCDSQFMIGSTLLVAPVIERGATARDIYLPPGTWRDELKGEIIIAGAGQWLNKYDVAIDEVPTFKRQDIVKDEL